MWFEQLTGFRERDPEQVRSNIEIDGETLTSKTNGRSMACGRLEIPTLAELRARVRDIKSKGHLNVREVVADVQKLHQDSANAGAMFQVASQFNLLEMVSPSYSPEDGIDIYENDRTQGPACAIACGAGTIYRNYFAEVNGQTGQSSDNQIDCLSDIGEALGNTDGSLWAMKNGYALPTASGLHAISQRLSAASEAERDELRQRLRIGVQWDTEVTLECASHTVTQAYCSALPVAYSSQPAARWADFAQLVLEASYEATICAAVLNAQNTGNKTVFLTLLGGGAFGNSEHWIVAALKRALSLYRHTGLQLAIVSYGRSKPCVQELVG